MTSPKQGLFPGLTWEEYCAIKALSWSTLKQILVSPGQLQHYREHGIKRSQQMVNGSAIDDYLTRGPDAFCERYAIKPPRMDLRTKAGKVWKREAGSRKPVGPEVIDAAHEVLNHGAAAGLLADGNHQVAVVWQDEETGVWLKGLMDIYVYGWHPLVADLKSTGQRITGDVSSHAYNMGYHRQLGMYTEGCRVVTGEEHEARIIFVEQTPPHHVDVYALSEGLLACGRDEFREALKLYAECEQNNHWPLHSHDLKVLDAPGFTGY